MISAHILGKDLFCHLLLQICCMLFQKLPLPVMSRPWFCPNWCHCKCFLVPPDLTKSGFAAVLNQLELTWRPSLATTSANRNDYKGYSLMSLRLATSWKFPCTCWADIPRVAIWSIREHIHLTLVLLRNKGALVHNKYHEDNMLPRWG